VVVAAGGCDAHSQSAGRAHHRPLCRAWEGSAPAVGRTPEEGCDAAPPSTLTSQSSYHPTTARTTAVTTTPKAHTRLMPACAGRREAAPAVAVHDPVPVLV